MKINVSEQDKVRLVNYNSYGLFRAKEKFSGSSTKKA
jgi:hypothetical protein